YSKLRRASSALIRSSFPVIVHPLHRSPAIPVCPTGRGASSFQRQEIAPASRARTTPADLDPSHQSFPADGLLLLALPVSVPVGTPRASPHSARKLPVGGPFVGQTHRSASCS